MRIQCGNCRHSHESVEAVKACYAGDTVKTIHDRRDRTVGGSSSGRMATPKMERYAGNLAAEREMSVATASEILTKIKAGSLTFDRARQFIDQFKNAPRKTDRRQTIPTAITQDGMYRNPDDGMIYKVQFNRAQGDGRRLYAKRLVLEGVPKGEKLSKVGLTPGTEVEDGTAKVRFVYAGAPGRVGLRPEMRMTLEEAKEFGALYGTCVRCGRTLTLEESIHRSMGAWCASKEGWA